MDYATIYPFWNKPTPESRSWRFRVAKFAFWMKKK